MGWGLGPKHYWQHYLFGSPITNTCTLYKYPHGIETMTTTKPSEALPRDETGSYLHLKLKRFQSIDDLTMKFAQKKRRGETILRTLKSIWHRRIDPNVDNVMNRFLKENYESGYGYSVIKVARTAPTFMARIVFGSILKRPRSTM